ncbi:MAG: PhoH family protein, partial [Planctomycetota bacterium]
VRKLVLVRPAVEAGEKLGFLPGDFQAKINPYLRPIFDALGALLDYGALRRYMERDVIEIAPLAYMRGRTLENAFIILDEAQNTTPSQMKMFLTRFGRNSKVVVTGDTTQVDLPMNVISGLKHARNVLGEVAGISWCELGDKDIVRHGLVARIVNAYEASEREAETPLFDRLNPRDARGNEIRRSSARMQPPPRPVAVNDAVDDDDRDEDDAADDSSDGLHTDE